MNGQPPVLISQVWLRDWSIGIERPVDVQWVAIPRVGDMVAVEKCSERIHDEHWVVDKVVWSTRNSEPRVDLRPITYEDPPPGEVEP